MRQSLVHSLTLTCWDGWTGRARQLSARLHLGSAPMRPSPEIPGPPCGSRTGSATDYRLAQLAWSFSRCRWACRHPTAPSEFRVQLNSRLMASSLASRILETTTAASPPPSRCRICAALPSLAGRTGTCLPASLPACLPDTQDKAGTYMHTDRQTDRHWMGLWMATRTLNRRITIIGSPARARRAIRRASGAPGNVTV